MNKIQKRTVRSMTVKLAVRIPDVMFDRLCTLQEREWNKPISIMLREAIGDYLNKNGV